MTTPHCPHCNAQGLEYLAFEPLATFALVYCKACGAIYGAVPCPQQAAEQPQDARPVVSEPLERPVPVTRAITPLAHLGNADLSIKQPCTPQRMEAEMKMARFYTPNGRYLRMIFDDGPPSCLVHKVEMREMVVPDGYLNAGRRLWVCPDFEECQTWTTMDDD